MASFPLELPVFKTRTAKRLWKIRLAVGAIGPLVALIDITVLLCAMELARRVYAGADSEALGYLGLATVAGLTFLLCSRTWHLQSFSRLLEPRSSLAYIGLAVLIGVGVISLLLFLLREEKTYSRGVLIVFAMVTPLILYAERLTVSVLLKRAIASNVLRGRRVVVIGERSELDELPRDEVLGFGVHEVARIVLSLSDEGEDRVAQIKSAVTKAMDIGRSGKASEYALIIPWSDDTCIASISAILRSSPRAIRLYPDRKTRATVSGNKSGADINSCFNVEIQPEPLSFADRFGKRIFDIVIALTALMLTAPVIAVAAILISLTSPGPIFFRQTRKGFDDREFKIWKFRTMTVMEDGVTIAQAQRHDTRVTPVGRVLRRTSVDELPQLLNVLTGEMSIVGPRPHAVAHDRQYGDVISEYALRRHVNPGLTGLAQVCGLRGETSTTEQMEKRVEKDLWYINNWSMWLDCKIVIRTFLSMAIHDAY